MKELNFKEVQTTALGVLKFIHGICEKENIRYFLAYGTLIGAVRHKGFIPWDDDLDIMMPRPDFDRFVEYCKNHDTSPFRLMNLDTTPGYPYFNTRFCDTRTVIDTYHEQTVDMGVFVDVCALDGLGEKYEDALQMMKKSRRLCSLMFLATRNKFHYGLTRGYVKNILKLPAYIAAHVLGKKFWIKKMNKLLENCDYENSNFVGCLVWSSYTPVKEVFPKHWAEEIIKGPFEDGVFYIPKHYDELLRNIYGNYMQLPPEKDRIYHHLFTAYKKDE